MVTLLAAPPRPLVAAAFDLVVDGELVRQVADHGGQRARRSSPDRPGAIDVRGRRAHHHPLRRAAARRQGRSSCGSPRRRTVELRALRIDDGATVAAAPSSGRRWVHHGSSISHCMEAASPTGTWPVVAAGVGGVDLHEPRPRRRVHARPVRRPHHPRPARRPHQPQGRHQPGERRHDARAHVRPRAARVPRHHPRGPPDHAAAAWCRRSSAPGRGPPRPHDRAGRQVRHHRGLGRHARHLPDADQDPLDHRIDRGQPSRAAGDANLHHLDGLELFGPTTSPTCPTTCTPTPPATSASASASPPSPSARTAPSPRLTGSRPDRGPGQLASATVVSSSRSSGGVNRPAFMPCLSA